MDFLSIATVVTFSFPFFFSTTFYVLERLRGPLRVRGRFFFGGGGRLVPSLHSSCIIYERALNGLAQGSAIM